MTHPLIEQIRDLIGPESDEVELGHNLGLRDAADLVAAWLAANPVGVTVKPLEWHNYDAWTWWAESTSGTYRVEERNGLWRATLNLPQTEHVIYEYETDGAPNDFEAAHIACQDDHNRRIMTALSSTPVAASEPAETAVKTQFDWVGGDKPECTHVLATILGGGFMSCGYCGAVSRGETAVKTEPPYMTDMMTDPANLDEFMAENPLPSDTPTLDALAMQRAAINVVSTFCLLSRWIGYAAFADRVSELVPPIAAITLPPGAALAEALRLPEIKTLVVDLHELREVMQNICGEDQLDRELVRSALTRIDAALAALGEQP